MNQAFCIIYDLNKSKLEKGGFWTVGLLYIPNKWEGGKDLSQRSYFGLTFFNIIAKEVQSRCEKVPLAVPLTINL